MESDSCPDVGAQILHEVEPAVPGEGGEEIPASLMKFGSCISPPPPPACWKCEERLLKTFMSAELQDSSLTAPHPSPVDMWVHAAPRLRTANDHVPLLFRHTLKGRGPWCIPLCGLHGSITEE